MNSPFQVGTCPPSAGLIEDTQAPEGNGRLVGVDQSDVWRVHAVCRRAEHAVGRRGAIVVLRSGRDIDRSP